MKEPGQFDVSYVAQLARISLAPEQEEIVARQLRDVLKYIEKLQEVDIRGVETTAHAVPMLNVYREDEARDWLSAEQALANAPRQANGLFIVPKVIE